MMLMLLLKLNSALHKMKVFVIFRSPRSYFSRADRQVASLGFENFCFVGLLYGAQDDEKACMYASKSLANIELLHQLFPNCSVVVYIDDTTPTEFIELAGPMVYLIHVKHCVGPAMMLSRLLPLDHELALHGTDEKDDKEQTNGEEQADEEDQAKLHELEGTVICILSS